MNYIRRGETLAPETVGIPSVRHRRFERGLNFIEERITTDAARIEKRMTVFGKEQTAARGERI